MPQISDGGPAFAKAFGGFAYRDGGSEYEAGNDGMSLRDYFAAKAMQAHLSIGHVNAFERLGLSSEAIHHTVACTAYSIADRMLADRSAAATVPKYGDTEITSRKTQAGAAPQKPLAEQIAALIASGHTVTFKADPRDESVEARYPDEVIARVTVVGDGRRGEGVFIFDGPDDEVATGFARIVEQTTACMLPAR